MVSHWSQELLGYHFSVVHQPDQMTVDIESLSRIFGSLTMQYIQVVTLLSNSDRKARPEAYFPGFKNSKQATKSNVSPNVPTVPLPILTAEDLRLATPEDVNYVDSL